MASDREAIEITLHIPEVDLGEYSRAISECAAESIVKMREVLAAAFVRYAETLDNAEVHHDSQAARRGASKALEMAATLAREIAESVKIPD